MHPVRNHDASWHEAHICYTEADSQIFLLAQEVNSEPQQPMSSIRFPFQRGEAAGSFNENLCEVSYSSAAASALECLLSL